MLINLLYAVRQVLQFDSDVRFFSQNITRSFLKAKLQMYLLISINKSAICMKNVASVGEQGTAGTLVKISNKCREEHPFEITKLFL